MTKTQQIIERIIITAAEGGIAYALSSNIGMSAGVAALLSLVYNVLRQSNPTIQSPTLNSQSTPPAGQSPTETPPASPVV